MEVTAMKEALVFHPASVFYHPAPVLIALLSGAEGVCEFAHPQFSELWTNCSPINKTMREIWPELEGHGYFELLEEVYKTGRSVYQYTYPNLPHRNSALLLGQLQFDFIYTPLQNAKGICNGVSIYAYKAAPAIKELTKKVENELKLKQLADFMPQIVWTANEKGQVDYLNSQFYEFSGFEKNNYNWFPILHPDDVERTRKLWLYSLSSGEEFKVEYRLKHGKTGKYRWFLGRACLIKDETGVGLKWFGTCTDIHDQKMLTQNLEKLVSERTNELMQATLQLKTSNKELEQYAYAASHDLQEPLRKIKVFSERLHKKIKSRLTEEELNYFDRITRSTERMSRLIDGILDFSVLKNGKQQFERTNLKDIVRHVVSDFEVLIKEKKAVIEYNELPVIEAVPVQMTQLFTNLLSNALKFSQPERSPYIRIISRQCEAGTQYAGILLKKETVYYDITFQDNGIGFEKQYSERIFEMFNRLHGNSEFEGSGIGLALCRQIIINHCGAIYVNSVPNQGTTFHLLLPKHQAPSAYSKST